MSSKEVVYYAVNNDPLYLFCARQSVLSLRRLNKSIQVKIFIFGDCTQDDATFFKTRSVDLISMQKTSRSRVTILKWFPLKHLDKFERVLFVDADTIFFED